MSNSEGDITSRLRARPLKRKRVNDSESEDDRGEPANSNESPSADTDWKHHDKYYFDDGNVVLLAEDTIFRVHKSVLTLHSGLFQDMLSLPQSEGSDSETMDGCPLVRTQDLALHITWLLEAMYNGATTEVLDKNRPLAKDIERLHHLSRIGDKYTVQALVDHVYQKLVMLFPVGSLSSWRPRKFLAQKELLLIIEMIRLWHPNAVHLLPIIFYAYCQLPLDEIGMTREGEPNQLSPEDMKRCLAAIPKLLARKIEMYNTFTSPTRNSELCPSIYDCDGDLFRLSNAALKRASMARLPCPLEDLVQWCNSESGGNSFWTELCENCGKGIEQELDRLRLATWNNLGKIFDIPEWQAPPQAQ